MADPGSDSRSGDVQSTADAIYDAVTMDAETKKSNHDKLWKVSRRMTSATSSQ